MEVDLPTFDQSTVEEMMREAARSLSNAAHAIIREDEAKEFREVNHDNFGPENRQIAHLYYTLFGKANWKLRFKQYNSLPQALRPDTTLAGLMGAMLYGEVLQKDLPWPCPSKIFHETPNTDFTIILCHRMGMDGKSWWWLRYCVVQDD